MAKKTPKAPEAPVDPNFPTWRYHATEAPRLVKDADALKVLGAGWKDTPAAFTDPAEAPKTPKAPKA